MAWTTGSYDTFLALGDWTDGRKGPCVWLDGGTDFSGCIKNAPVMTFNIYGDCRVRQDEWMNRFNCPNLYNEEYLRAVERFVQVNLPILYLLYSRHLDKEDVAAYLREELDFEALLAALHHVPEDSYSGLLACTSCAQLHEFCVTQGIYGAQERRENGRPLLCHALKPRRPAFQLSDWDGEVTLESYWGETERVIIPEGVCAIEAGAFEGHGEIKQVIFPESLHDICERAFAGCTGLEMLHFPAGLAFVDECAFEGCTSLRYVDFEKADGPNSALFLEKNVFWGCEQLAEVRLPGYAETWGNPFSYCPELNVLEGETDDSANGILWDGCLYVGCNGTKIPPGIREIGAEAFVGCTKLCQLYIPESVVSIDREAFVDCPYLHILCHRDSRGEAFAREMDIPWSHVDEDPKGEVFL